MWSLRKDEPEQQGHNHFASTPPALADHPMFSKGTVGILSAENPQHKASGTGTAGLQKELQTMGLSHELTHGAWGGPKQTAFIVHNPTREQMYRLGHKFGQETVLYSQDGQHEMLYTHGPNAGKAHIAKPDMHYSPTQPKDFYTHLPGRGFVTLHFNEDVQDTPVRGTMPLAHLVADPRQGSGGMVKSERDLLARFAADLRATLKKYVP